MFVDHLYNCNVQKQNISYSNYVTRDLQENPNVMPSAAAVYAVQSVSINNQYWEHLTYVETPA